MFWNVWLGISSEDILADVNENKEVPTVIFSTINKNLQITETPAESSPKGPPPTVYAYENGLS